MPKKKENVTQKSEILLITTPGCEGCAIISRLIDEGIKLSKKKVDFISKDAGELDKKWLTQNKVTDFPTVFLIKNDVIKYRFVGTRPAIVIAQWIKLNL